MRYIREHLYVGDIFDGMDADDFETVINLSNHPLDTTDYHFSLSDGDHDRETFNEAVKTGVAAVERDEDVLIHCNAGVSRSVAVATAVFVALDGGPWEQRYSATKCGFNEAAIELQKSSREYGD